MDETQTCFKVQNTEDEHKIGRAHFIAAQVASTYVTTGDNWFIFPWVASKATAHTRIKPFCFGSGVGHDGLFIYTHFSLILSFQNIPAKILDDTSNFVLDS